MRLRALVRRAGFRFVASALRVVLRGKNGLAGLADQCTESIGTTLNHAQVDFGFGRACDLPTQPVFQRAEWWTQRAGRGTQGGDCGPQPSYTPSESAATPTFGAFAAQTSQMDEITELIRSGKKRVVIIGPKDPGLCHNLAQSLESFPRTLLVSRPLRAPAPHRVKKHDPSARRF